MNIRPVRRLIAWLAALLLTLILTGCGSAIPTPKPSPTILPAAATVTMTITARPTSTPIPPTEAPPVSEFDRKMAPFNPYSERWMCGDVFPSFTDFSPANAWFASSCENGGGYGGNLSLTNKNGDFLRMTDKQLFGKSMWIIFTPVKWSNDGKNLYFSTSHRYTNIYLPETPTIPWCFNGIDVSLVKVNLETGSTQFVLGNSHSYDNKVLLNTYAFAISPSGKFLAYSLQDRNHAKIILRDLENNRETKLLLEKNIEKDTAVTDLAWAADELTLDVQYIMCGAMLKKEVSVEVNGK